MTQSTPTRTLRKASASMMSAGAAVRLCIDTDAEISERRDASAGERKTLRL